MQNSPIVSGFSERIKWYVKIRWLFLLAISVPGILSEILPHGSINPEILRDIILALFALSTNAVFYLLAKKIKSARALKTLAIIIIVADIAVITTLVFLKGGVESRSPILYVFPILLSSVVFGHIGLFLTTLACVVVYDSLLTLDLAGVLHTVVSESPQLHQNLPYIITSLVFFSSALFIIGLLIDFVIGLADSGRKQVEAQSKILAEAQRIGKIGSWEWDMLSDKITWSDELYDLFGLKPGSFEASYQAYIQLIHPLDRNLADNTVQAALKNHQPFKFDHRVMLPDGKIRWLAGQGIVETSKDGKAIKMRGTAQDITQNKINEEKLQQQAVKLKDTQAAMVNVLEDLGVEKDNLIKNDAKNKAVIQSIGAGLIATDEKGRVSVINKAGLRLLGITEKDIVGKWFPGVIISENEKGEEVLPVNRPITQAILTGEPLSARSRFRRPDGTVIPVSVTASPIMLGDHPIGAIEVFQDITKEKEIEKAKDEFLSIASHQLRTPATGVKQSLGLLAEGYLGKLTDKQKEVVDLALNSNERELYLIEDLLRIATVDAGKMKIEKKDSDLCQLVREATIALQPSIDKRHQHLDVVLPNKPLIIPADSEKLMMVLDNLTSNASKYTPDGGNVTIKLEPTQTGVAIAVKDSGIGIAQEDLKKLFKKFIRLDSQLARDRGGTGVGLYLAERIVNLHGGKIVVNSTAGKGSEFIIQLPKKGTPE